MIMIDGKGGGSLIFSFVFFFSSFRVGIEEEFYYIRISLHAFCVPYFFIIIIFLVFFKIKKEDQNTIR